MRRQLDPLVRPVPGLDHVAQRLVGPGAHLRARRLERATSRARRRPRQFLARLRQATLDDAVRLTHPPALQLGVDQPLVVVAAEGRPHVARRPLGVDHRHGPLVDPHRIVPLAQRQEDVAGHVQGVAGVGRNVGVEPRGPHAQRRVIRIVVAVDQVVQHAGVALVGREHLLQQARRAHVERHVAALVRQAQDRQGVEGAGVDVVGVGARAPSPWRRNRGSRARPCSPRRRGSRRPPGRPAPARSRPWRRGAAGGGRQPVQRRAGGAASCSIHTGWV